MRDRPPGPVPRAVRTPSAEDLSRASEVVRTHLTPSPVVVTRCRGRSVALKVETVQPTGSFKVRGSLAAVAGVGGRDPLARVVAASAGNHGLGVAWAAERLGIPATIVVPETAAPTKLAGLARFSAEVIRVGGGYDGAEAQALAMARQAEVGGAWVFVSPYNDTEVIAGQATVGTELLDQVDDLACVVVPVGGGGLISGVALALAGTGIPVFGVEADASAAMRAALGRPGPGPRVVVRPTLADGLAGNLEPGSITIDLVRANVAGLVTVTEDQIEMGMRHLAAEHGLVAEGSGAVGMAALLAGLIPSGRDGLAAVVVTGRNIDLAALARVLGP